MTTNISNIPRTGYSVGNSLNGADAVAQDSGNILSGVCLQLNHHIVRSNYLSYNPTRNGTQPLNHLWYSFGFHIDQDIRIHRHLGTPLQHDSLMHLLQHHHIHPGGLFLMRIPFSTVNSDYSTRSRYIFVTIRSNSCSIYSSFI